MEHDLFMVRTPSEPPLPDKPLVIDWRGSGFVAVDLGFPETDRTAHRPVKLYRDEVLTGHRITLPDGKPGTVLSAPASDFTIRPACIPNPTRPYVELSPHYAESRGAVWCRECLSDVA